MSTPVALNAALLTVAAFACVMAPREAYAQETVECRSHDYQYTECQAPLDEPQLVHQISGASCIVNRTWGFNPKTRRIWVAEGCAGVFADPNGYHYGRGDKYDADARHYDARGHDTGKLAAGLVAAVLIGAALDDDSSKNKKKGRDYTTSNDYYSNPSHKKHKKSGGDDFDSRPAFDKEGNPNFDTQGGYIGCHGVGCEVDNPDN